MIHYPIALALAILGAVGLIVIVLLIYTGVLPDSCGCFPFVTLAIALTTLAMVTGGAGKPSSGDSKTTVAGDKPQVPSGRQNTSGDRRKFQLKISILAIGFALLSAIGFVMLFQQMGVAYPTITIVVLSLVLALVAGIVLPTLAKTFSRRRK